MPLHIKIRQEQSITVVHLSGPIVVNDGASELRESLAHCLQDGQRQIIVNVASVESIDAAGVDVFRDLQDKAKQAGGDLRIAGARYPFLAELAYFGGTGLFDYYADDEQASADFGDTDSGTKGVRRFDILEFVKEQEKEDQEQAGGDKESVDPSPA